MNIEITTTYEGIIPVSEILQEAKENREQVASCLWEPMIRRNVSDKMQGIEELSPRKSYKERRKAFGK